MIDLFSEAPENEKAKLFVSCSTHEEGEGDPQGRSCSEGDKHNLVGKCII